MKLARLQKAVLQMYWRYHVGGWALGPVLQSMWWRWLLLLVYAVLGGWLLSDVSTGAAGLVVGVAAGAFLRDIGRIVQSCRIWPTLHEITDWQRVEQLLKAHENADLTADK